MKIKHQIMIAVCAITAIALQSCKKDRTIIEIEKTISNSTNINFNPENFFAESAPKNQSFTLNAANGGYIIGSGGTKIYFPPNALLHQNGTAVTGNAEFILVEYLTKADMIFSHVTVTAGQQLLESGGMFYLMAKQNGEELKIDPSKTINIVVPKSNPSNFEMSFWDGKVKLNDDLNKVNWSILDSTKTQLARDSANGDYYEIGINISSFGFYNFDCLFSKYKNYITDLSVKVNKNISDSNSTVLMLFRDFNAASYCYYDKVLKDYSSGYKLPLNETINIIVARKTGNNKDDLAYIIKEVLLEDKTVVDLTNSALIPCTYNQLETLIKSK